MPELPEVEVTRRVLASELIGLQVKAVKIRTTKLRNPIPPDLSLLVTESLVSIERNAKYLVFTFSNRQIVIHLGMTGSLRLVRPGVVYKKADYCIIDFGLYELRYHDPRKFGVIEWYDEGASAQPITGIEPLSSEFTPEYLGSLREKSKRRIKDILMDNRFLLGVGNIYASESLFRAGIRPDRTLPSLTDEECSILVTTIKEVLELAIDAGMKQRNIYVTDDILSGYFDYDRRVYGRRGEQCLVCCTTLESMKISGRSSFYCPTCQI